MIRLQQEPGDGDERGSRRWWAPMDGRDPGPPRLAMTA